MVMIFRIPDPDMGMSDYETGILRYKIGDNWYDDKKRNKTDSDTMEYELTSTTLELTEVTSSRNNRESCTFCLEHYEYDDHNRENQEEYREKRHNNRELGYR